VATISAQHQGIDPGWWVKHGIIGGIIGAIGMMMAEMIGVAELRLPCSARPRLVRAAVRH
jgi:hypothetical protein